MPDADFRQIGKSIWLTQKIQPYREMQMKPIYLVLAQWKQNFSVWFIVI